MAEQMNGAESLVRTLLAGGVERLLHQSRHVRDAFRRGARQGAGHALRAGPVRGRGDGRGRRLLPHARASPPRPCCIWAPASPTGSPTCTTPRRRSSGIVNIVGEHATYHIAHDAPLTADIEGVARAHVALGQDLAQLAHDRRRRRAGDRGRAAAARPDRDADPAGRHGLGPRRRHRRGRTPPAPPKVVGGRRQGRGRHAARAARGRPC